MMHEVLTHLSLTRLAGLIRRRKVSALEVTKACLSQIELWQPRLNAFVEVEGSRALTVARRLDGQLRRNGPVGLLHGVPLAHKDLFYRRGKVCGAGSKIRANWTAPYTATVMQRLEAAGAIHLGRLHMAEFAADPTGHNAHLGPCRNPWDQAYITGGSSSGSGAAVAARLIFGALGSDTGGSIRVPAAANGIVGLMPSHGRVSRYGAVARAWSLDRIGPMARTAQDCARLLRVIAGPDPLDGMAAAEKAPNFEREMLRGVRGLTVGIADTFFFDNVTDDVGRALEAASRVLEELGAKIKRVPAPDPSALFLLNDLILKCEAAALHGKWLRERSEDYADYLRARLEGGLVIPATRYIEALMMRGPMLTEFLRQSFAKASVLFCPLIPHPLPTLEDVSIDGADPEDLARAAGLSNLTRLFNYLGVPAISVPCGFDRNGLPVAFQLVAPPFREDLLLSVAHAYQSATDWHQRVPQLERT
jgi:aspartyl-tRNA(Asn)/glutamyl-tRNA(Gln) amidotransferase subunit A